MINEDNSENIKSCIVLCGGHSRRMGQDKGSMIIHKKPMIKHVLCTLNYIMDEVIIVLNDQTRIDRYSEFITPHDYSYNITITQDKFKNRGPISGIMEGLENISGTYSLVLPCDSPYISKDYLKNIFNEITDSYQAIVPCHDITDKLKTSEPLHSIYNKSIIPIIERQIENDILHIKGLIEKIDTKFVLIDNKKIEKKEFRNLNCPEDI